MGTGFPRYDDVGRHDDVGRYDEVSGKSMWWSSSFVVPMTPDTCSLPAPASALPYRAPGGYNL